MKDTKFQIRISKDLLRDFDALVGRGNRSSKIINLMQDYVRENYNFDKPKDTENGKNNYCR